MWYSRHSVTSRVKRDHHFSWSAAMFLLTQPRRLLLFRSARACCWLMFTSLSAKTPRSLSAEHQLLSYSVPSLYHFGDFFLSRCRHLHLSLLNFIIFLLHHSSILSRSLWMATLLCSIWPGPTRLASSTNLMRVYSRCLQVIDNDVKQDQSQYRSLWYSGCYTHLWMECDQLTIQSVFTCLAAHPSRP